MAFRLSKGFKNFPFNTTQAAKSDKSTNNFCSNFCDDFKKF